MDVEGWKNKRLTDLAQYINGYAFKPDDWEKEGLPIIRIEQLKNPNSITDYHSGKLPVYNIIDNGDLIFSWSASLFLSFWTHGRAALNQHLFKVQEFDGVNKNFLKSFIEFHLPEITKASHGSTMQHITRKELDRFQAIFPINENEQTQIAAILSNIDRAIEQTEAIIAKQQRIKTGLMQDLLTKGIDEDGNVRSEETHEFKDSAIGRIPVEWQICSLGEKARIRSGSTPSRANQKFWVEGTYPWVKTAEVNFSEITETEEKITELALYCCALNLEPTGTLLVAMYGQGKTRGRSAILGIDATTNQACAAIFGNKEICQKYLFYYFSFQYDEIRNIGHGSNQTNLNGRLLADFLIKLPSHKEQFKIAEILIQIDRQIYQRQTTFMKLQKTKQGLMQDLLTGKVRVTELLRDRAEASP